MLIGGKRSTGIRTRTVVPTIAITRQQTIMKYGFLIAKRDIRTCPHGSRRPPWERPSLRDEIRSANRQQRARSEKARKRLPPGSLLRVPVGPFFLRYDLASS